MQERTCSGLPTVNIKVIAYIAEGRGSCGNTGLKTLILK